MSVAEVGRKSRELQEQARRRVAAIYVMGAANAGIPLLLTWFLPELRVGLIYLAVTAVFLVSYVRRRSTYRTLAATSTPGQGLAFYRDLLERERDFRRESTRWFTIGPGLNISVLGIVYVTSPLFQGTAPELAVLGAVAIAHVVVLIRVAQKLRSEARRYQVELDGLGSLSV